MNFFRRQWEKFKAWRRKERMIEGVQRGRCFEKKESGDSLNTSSVCEAKLAKIKVTRVDGTVEEINLGES